jgi:histidine triad (HIT) family protein
MTIFKKIIDRQIPADIVYEDKYCLAFRDVKPQGPTHILLIPKEVIKSMADVENHHAAILGHLMIKAAEIAQAEGIASEGYRLVVNTRAFGGQTVDHLHIHILGGRPFSWPPG